MLAFSRKGYAVLGIEVPSMLQQGRVIIWMVQMQPYAQPAGCRCVVKLRDVGNGEPEMALQRGMAHAHLSCERARVSTGKSPCSPTTPSMLLGRMEMILIRPSCDPVSTVSSSKATSASTELGCPA